MIMDQAQLELIEKWDGKLPNMVMPSGYTVLDLHPVAPTPSVWIPVLQYISIYFMVISLLLVAKLIFNGTEKKSC